MRLLIAIPTLDYVISDFMRCLIDLTMKLKDDGVNFDVKIQSGTLVHMARDKLARHAVNKGYTHVLWLDSDMIFEPSLLDDLMTCGKDFVTGIAHGRRKPFGSCLFKQIMPPVRFEEYPKSPFQVAGCGMAVCLIKTSILKSVFLANGTCYTPMNNIGEDLAFCERARKLGFEIWAEPMVRVGHVGHIAIYPGDEERWKDEISNYGEVKS